MIFLKKMRLAKLAVVNFFSRKKIIHGRRVSSSVGNSRTRRAVHKPKGLGAGELSIRANCKPSTGAVSRLFGSHISRKCASWLFGSHISRKCASWLFGSLALVIRAFCGIAKSKRPLLLVVPRTYERLKPHSPLAVYVGAISHRQKEKRNA